MKPPSQSHELGVALVTGLGALCCGLPLLLAALAASGVGAWLLSEGAFAAALLVLVAAMLLGISWLLRRGAIRSGRDLDCCAPAATRKERAP